MSSCCDTDEQSKKSFDYILWGSSLVILFALALYAFGIDWAFLQTFSETTIELLSTMWWGIALGIVFVGIMNKVPREYFSVILGRGDTFGGVLRAAIAGLLLDLCSHGILMVGAKLYERGASLSQVMTFLIASPWNSLSLTIILITLIGWQWTLAFIIGSALIAIVSGLIFNTLVKRGVLPENPNQVSDLEGFSIRSDAKVRLKNLKLNPSFFIDLLKGGMNEAQMLLRWLLLGVILAAAMRTFIPHDVFTEWFGPTFFGLIITLVMTTILEVCSEGSAPIASEILNIANAPGNAFTFLMAGVSTDYTEIMVLKEATKSWKMALFLPLVTVPQVIIMGLVMNWATLG